MLFKQRQLRAAGVMNTFIRAEQCNDYAAISAVLSSAFPSDQEARLVERLRQHNRLLISLVVEVAGELVGHIAFSPVEIAGLINGAAGVGLAPLAVRPDLQRRGLGAQLVREGLFTCGRKSVGFVVVLGEPEYYRQFGFQQAGPLGIENEYRAGDEFMILELRAGAITPGLIRYAPEFSELTV